MTDDPRRITIETVKSAFQRTEMEKKLLPVLVKQWAVSHDEKKNQTRIELDLGFRNLPVARLQFEITTTYFYRGYELFGRNDSKEKVPRKTETKWDTIEHDVPWKSVHRGVLYRIQHKQKISESLKVEGVSAPYRYLQKGFLVSARYQPGLSSPVRSSLHINRRKSKSRRGEL